MEFSYDGFRAILREVKTHGYQFHRLDRPAAGKVFYLRHDVDISPRCALRLGQAAADEGAHSSLFFQLNAETYNPFSVETLDIIGKLRSLGHCVGLHVDENLVGQDEAKIAHTLRWFSECCTGVDPAVSFHRPSPAVLGRTFRGFASGYAAAVWAEDRYLSDSRRSWDFRDKLSAWLREGRAPIQLLLHPEWWHPHPDARAIWDDLCRRRLNELARYAALHFTKVFSSVAVPSSTEDGM